MEKLGWKCALASDQEICPPVRSLSPLEKPRVFAKYLADYLKRRASEFDVVDFDHMCLPFHRKEFPAKPLFVARSVLLVQHFDRIAIPSARSFRGVLRHWIKGPFQKHAYQKAIQQAQHTCTESDIVNVSNTDDKAELTRRSIRSEKIYVIPFGLIQENINAFQAVRGIIPEKPIIAFVGTFDLRKGASEFPEIVRIVTTSIPGAKFRLLGSKYQNKEKVMSHFPEELRQSIEVVPNFRPDQLPTLLSDCSIGVFPSYIEGFGFGVLEMLAASLPVIAYRSPGPPMMLADEYLAPRGDWKCLSQKLIDLLGNNEKLGSARRRARNRAQDFPWNRFAQQTSEVYKNSIRLKNGSNG